MLHLELPPPLLLLLLPPPPLGPRRHQVLELAVALAEPSRGAERHACHRRRDRGGDDARQLVEPLVGLGGGLLGEERASEPVEVCAGGGEHQLGEGLVPKGGDSDRSIGTEEGREGSSKIVSTLGW